MYPFKRLLVGLDLTEMDITVLKYTALIAKIFPVDKVYFMHVAKDLDLPEEIKEKYPDLLAPMDESIEDGLQNKVSKYFDTEVDYEIEAQEGDPSDKILRWAKVKDVDLMVMGRKIQLRGKGVLPGKMAKIALCSMLFVPENAGFTIEKVLVPLDFSKTSELALRQAHYIAQQGKAELVMQHAYIVPSGFHKSGKSHDEFAKIMEDHAQQDLNQFVANTDLEGLDEARCVFDLDDDRDPSDKAYATAKNENASLVVIGSKGRTGAAAILLGSTADKMAQQTHDIPLLIVKNKKENLNFIEALLQL